MKRIAIEEAKEAALISTIRRQERLKAWSDYIGFGVTKGLGGLALIFGLVSLTFPSFLPIHIGFEQSKTAIGMGLALLAGNKVVTLISKILNALKP